MFPKDIEDEKNGCLEPHREIRSFLFAYTFFLFCKPSFFIRVPQRTMPLFLSLPSAQFSFMAPPPSPFPLGLSHAIPPTVPPWPPPPPNQGGVLFVSPQKRCFSKSLAFGRDPPMYARSVKTAPKLESVAGWLANPRPFLRSGDGGRGRVLVVGGGGGGLEKEALSMVT